MPKSRRAFAGCSIIAALAAAPIARAEDEKKEVEAKAEERQEMSAAEKAIMEKYMKAAEPGAAHKEMAKLVGKWKLEVTSWPAPGAPPHKSAATAEFKTLMGGRYLQEEVHGDMGGTPFAGMGVSGYDNVTRERFLTWIDSMTTGPMVMRGKCAADAKKCTIKGPASDPIAGKRVTMTQTTTMVDDNKFTFEIHGPGPRGKVFKMLEIVYTRQ